MTLRFAALALYLNATSAAATPLSQPRVLDDFETSGAWTALPASGVEMKLSTEPGPRGRALRVDFNFKKGGGYAVLHRALDMTLPENYRVEFQLRGEAAPQNLEFKLLDPSGENVWWCNRVNHEFTRDWTTERIRKRQISFAWGPKGGGELERAAALEFAITAGSGGSGTVWFDDLTLVPLPVPTAPPPLIATASSTMPAHAPALALDGRPESWWASRPTDVAPVFTLDLGTSLEFGGLTLDWRGDAYPPDYVVEFDDGDGRWRTVRAVRGGDGGRDELDLPESETRRVRVRATGRVRGAVALTDVTVQPLQWSASPERFLMNVAKGRPRGHFPRAFLDEQLYWTVVGVDGDRDEGLMDEDARLETGRAQWSLEPFLTTEQGLRTWADGTSEQSLAEGSLPIPTVTHRVDSLALEVTAFARATEGPSQLVARYHIRNLLDRARTVTLHVAIRPFQVNPPSQFLNVPGGPARISTLARAGSMIMVNGVRGVNALVPPTAFGAMTFDEGDLVARLAAGTPPVAEHVTDPTGRASGVLSWTLELPAHGDREVLLLVPFGAAASVWPDRDTIAGWQEEAIRTWREALGSFTFSGGGNASDLAATVRAQLAYVLVNRDNVGIQPGSRSYERSWIRDGSLTSSALLRSGMTKPVGDYLRWFAHYQYADGKVPCCVDTRGSDPVPEHDSHGEFVFLAAEYLRLTDDRALVESVYPNVRAAVAYLDTLRGQRRTAEWRTPANAPFFGILPPSISHEGYSAKPMHSYWDDLFALRGYKDGVWLAEALGHTEDARWMRASRDTFTTEFAAAVRATLAARDIRYVPGSSDLGDFDATSTTIALTPVQAGAVLPSDALRLTFERYWEFFQRRRNGDEVWDAYTPYELRNVGAFVRLGWRTRAHELLDWFLRDRRPEGWRQWAEVVDRVPRHARFVGDMPHTWVGTDFVRSVQEMLAYEVESDSSLVLAAGVADAWLADSALVVRGLHTRWGTLGYRLRSRAKGEGLMAARLELEGAALRNPPGGIALMLPEFGNGGRYVVRATYADGRTTRQEAAAGTVRLVAPRGRSALPTVIEWAPPADLPRRR